MCLCRLGTGQPETQTAKYVCVCVSNSIKIILKIHTTIDFPVFQLKALKIVNKLAKNLIFYMIHLLYVYITGSSKQVTLYNILLGINKYRTNIW